MDISIFVIVVIIGATGGRETNLLQGPSIPFGLHRPAILIHADPEAVAIRFDADTGLDIFAPFSLPAERPPGSVRVDAGSVGIGTIRATEGILVVPRLVVTGLLLSERRRYAKQDKKQAGDKGSHGAAS